MLGGTSDLKFSKLFKRNIELNHNMRLNSYTSTAKSDMLQEKALFGCTIDSYGQEIFIIGGVVKS